MSLRGIPLDQINESHLQSLIEDEVREGREIEYKEVLPGGSDSDKSEFLSDVVSFANSGGGDLVYGMREERDADSKPTGLPSEIIGITDANIDAQTLRFENLTRDGIAPRIIGFLIRPIPLGNGGNVLVLRIPRSFAVPHMVTFRGVSRFYARTSAGKYQLDVGEIRTAFLASETFAQRLGEFRVERIARLASNEGPLPLIEGVKIVLHLVPYGAFDLASQINPYLGVTRELSNPLSGSQTGSRYNFDGYLTFESRDNAGPATSYMQIFRNGVLESVRARIANPERRFIPSLSYEQEILEAVSRYLRLLRELRVGLPLYLMLTLMGVKGYRMGVDIGPAYEHPPPIDRDNVVIPEAVIEDFTVDVPHVLRPAFDAVWQSAGWRGSLNYNEEGQWVPH